MRVLYNQFYVIFIQGWRAGCGERTGLHQKNPGSNPDIDKFQ